MPELADVEGYRRNLAEHGQNRRIRHVDVQDRGVLRNTTPRAFSQAVRGRRFTKPERLGKYLLARTDGPTLLLHFGMTGELSWSATSEGRHRHDRVVISLDKGELRYRDQRKLQGIWLITSDAELQAALGPHGPDAYGLSRREVEARVGNRRAPLKTALMDQGVISGLGNLLVDEILWRARLHPQRRPQSLDSGRWRELHRAMTQVLRASVRRGRIPTTSSWLTGVRDEPDAQCPRCGARLHHLRLGGRTAVLCPRCQRAAGRARHASSK